MAGEGLSGCNPARRRASSEGNVGEEQEEAEGYLSVGFGMVGSRWPERGLPA